MTKEKRKRGKKETMKRGEKEKNVVVLSGVGCGSFKKRKCKYYMYYE